MLGSFFFQAEDGIRDLVRSRGLGDVYKRQVGDFTSLEKYVEGHNGRASLEDAVIGNRKEGDVRHHQGHFVARLNAKLT